MIARALASLRREPRRLFAIDGIGALVSAAALGVVLPRFARELGTTREVLWALALAPVLYAGVDLAAALLQPARWRLFARVIAAANVGYVVLSIAALSADGVALRAPGAAYFAVEAIVVCALAALEVEVSREP